jgi:uncharacterized membrane protein YhaH (DUF805 family)
MDFKAFIIDPKDAKRILIGAGGNLSPMEFAQGLVAIVAAGFVMQILGIVLGAALALVWGLISLIIGLGLAFAWVCIFSKRFHDAGQSGWMTLAAIGVAVVLYFIVGLILNPIFPAPSITSLGDMGSIQSMQTSMALRGMITTLIVNGALGFYMFRLATAAAAPAEE